MKMVFLIKSFLLIATAISQVSAQMGGANVTLNSIRTQLFQSLFANYNPDIIPDSVVVQFGVFMDNANFISDTALDINFFYGMVWNDPRLSWDQSQFNVSLLRIKPSNIWIPDIQLYNGENTRNGDIPGSCIPSNVQLSPNGTVLWSPTCNYIVRCKNTYQKFPNKPQTCQLSFFSWTYVYPSLDLQFLNNLSQIDVSQADTDNGLTVVSGPATRVPTYFSCCPAGTYINTIYNLTLQQLPVTGNSGWASPPWLQF